MKISGNKIVPKFSPEAIFPKEIHPDVLLSLFQTNFLRLSKTMFSLDNLFQLSKIRKDSLGIIKNMEAVSVE